MDISVVVAACVFGMVCGSMCLQLTQELNKILREVSIVLKAKFQLVQCWFKDKYIFLFPPQSDDELHMFTDVKRDRRRGLILLFVVLITIISAILIDIWVWHTKANKTTDIAKIKINVNVMGYLPFYVLYIVMMIFHVEFAQSAIGLGRRYRRLNNALRNLEKSDVFVVPTINVCNVKTVNDKYDILKSRNTVIEALNYKNSTKFYIERLARVHSSLGGGIEKVSR